MNKIITFSIILLISVNFLSAQSKKELDLRIDTLQTALNNEKQVVQNLTLQIQNLTIELEKMNKTLLLLTSQVVKQDSMNNSLLVQLKTASIEADSLTLFVLSSVKKPIFPDNLLIDITGLYENGYMYPTPKVYSNLDYLESANIFDEPYVCIKKGNIETVGAKKIQWYHIRVNISIDPAQGWVLGANLTFLQPDVNTDITEFAGIYEIMVRHPAHELIFVEVDKTTQKIKVMTMAGSYDNGNIVWCGADDSKTNDFSSAITLKNPKISGYSLTSDSQYGWFAKAEDPAKKIKTVKGLIWGGAFYRKVK
jgi:hypothetical protein